MPTAASSLRQSLDRLQCALERVTSPTGSVYRALRRVINNAATDAEFRLDPALIRHELPDLLADLNVPEIVVPVGVMRAGVREAERTAALASVAAVAADLAVSRAIGQATATPVLEWLLDLMMLGRRLLPQVGIDPAAEAARVDSELERRLQGALITIRIQLYAALAPQIAERLGNTPEG